jgi:tRNA U34 2-thiouridine synthase MnmA/TrmU
VRFPLGELTKNEVRKIAEDKKIARLLHLDEKVC